MKEFIEELKYNREVNINNDLENRIDIDYVIERLEEIEKDNVSVYYRVAKDEVEMAIEDIHNDELYCYDEELMKQLDNINIDEIADKVYDDDSCWRDIYNCARWYVFKEIGKEDK